MPKKSKRPVGFRLILEDSDSRIQPVYRGDSDASDGELLTYEAARQLARKDPTVPAHAG